MKNKLFVMSAASGAGKTTLKDLVIKDFPDIKYSISPPSRILSSRISRTSSIPFPLQRANRAKAKSTESTTSSRPRKNSSR